MSEHRVSDDLYAIQWLRKHIAESSWSLYDPGFRWLSHVMTRFQDQFEDYLRGKRA